jgi:hypothetical protein
MNDKNLFFDFITNFGPMCQLYDLDMITYLRQNNVRVRFVLCNYGPVYFAHALPASTFAIYDPTFDGLCIGMLQPGTQV